MSGNAPLALQTVTTLAVGVMMVVAGLGKRKLEHRPTPKPPRLGRFRRRR